VTGETKEEEMDGTAAWRLFSSCSRDSVGRRFID